MHMYQELKIKINGGTLVAGAYDDPNNSSVFICFETEEGDIIDIATASTHGNNKNIHVYVFEDVTAEDPTYEFILKHKEMLEALYGNEFEEM